jgi:hypothetical protein
MKRENCCLKLEYLGHFEYIFEANLGFHSSDKAGSFDEKFERSKISCNCAFKYEIMV